MNEIKTNNLTYNDTPEVRLFSSEEFNWCLDKSTGISCCWGRDVKETPQYDPCGPQEFLWKITSFDLNKYIKYFNFLANIKKKENNIVSDIPEEDYIKNVSNYICMSTFGSIILYLDNLNTMNLEDIKLFLDYIRNFNIEPKIQIQYNKDIDYSKLKNLTSAILLLVDSDFIATELLEDITKIKEEKFDLCIKFLVSKNSTIQLYKVINNIDKNISCIFYIIEPYVTTRKYLDIQQKCLNKGLQNICLSQCCKKHYSKDIIGSLMIELPCSACRYTLYLEDNKIFTCELAKDPIGNIEDYNTIYDFWNSDKIISIRKNLIDTNRCQG